RGDERERRVGVGVERVDDERNAASGGGGPERDCDLSLCGGTVAAEVARDEQRVGLAGVEQHLDDALEAPDVLFGAACEVDRIVRRRGGRQYARELSGERR